MASELKILKNSEHSGSQLVEKRLNVPTSSKIVTQSPTSREGHAGFPTTRWGLLDAMRSGTETTRAEILGVLARDYWRPLYAFIRSKGHGEEEAKDLVQSFLLACIDRNLFAQADQERGRFRTFLRSCCDHFLSNERRAERAKRRRPPGGIVSMEEMLGGPEERRAFEPKYNETPEDVFNRVWARGFLERVLTLFREECRRTAKERHLEIFELRIVKPALEDTTPPSMRDLALRFGVREKQVANMLLTTRRAFQKLLQTEIQVYALSEADVRSEIRDLFDFLALKDA